MFFGILCLILLAVALLQFSGVQHAIAQKAMAMISEKTRTRIEIGSVNIAFTHSVVLENVFVESLRGDTLLCVRSLAADVNLFGLFSNEITFTNIRIDSLTAHISRTLPDSGFNFDFILSALSSDTTIAEGVPDTSSGSGWTIQFGTVNLYGIHASYDDEVDGLNIQLDLGTLEAAIETFDLEMMRFHVKELSLSNTAASVIQTMDSPPDTSSSEDIDIGFGTISLNNILLTYENKVADDRYHIDLGTSLLVAQKIDLPSHRIEFKKFLLERSAVVIIQTKKTGNPELAGIPGKTGTAVLPWIISLDQLILNENSLRYDVPGTDKSHGFDPNHLRLDDMTIHAENMYYSDNRIAAKIRHTSIREHSGIELREMSGGFMLDTLHAQLTDFTVVTEGSRIHLNAQLRYSSLSDLVNISDMVSVNATIRDSHVAVSEILLFLPSLPLKNTPGASVRFAATLSGSIGDMQVKKFLVSTGDSTSVDLTGTIRGLPEIETAQYDITVHQFITGRSDIQLAVADTVLPKGIIVPASIHMNGFFNGTFKDFSASAGVVTGIGNVAANVNVNSVQGSKSARWKSDVDVKEFDIGALLGDSVTFGPVSLKASAAGTGLNKDDIKARLHVSVDKAVVYGYPYRRLVIDGTASPEMFAGKAEMQDSNIAFIFNGTINTGKEKPAYKFTFDLQGADLHRLNFTADDIRVSGIITSDLVGKDINNINGNVDVRHVVIVKNNKRYVIDSLVYVSMIVEEQTHISVESAIFAGQFDGTITPGQLPDVLEKHCDNYFALKGIQRNDDLNDQSFSFTISIRDPSTLTEIFIPELHRLSVGTIEGNFDSDKKNLNVNIDIPGIGYNEMAVDSLAVKITSDTDMLQAIVRVGSLSDSTIRITNLQLAVNARHDSIDVVLQSTRNDGFKKMLIAGIFTSVPEGYKFRFREDGIVFQNVPWTVPPDNFLHFGKNKFIVHNILMQGEGQSLTLNSTDETDERSPLKIECNNLDLSAFSQVVERKSGLLGGLLNGTVVLQNFEKQMAFTSDLKIKDLKFNQMPVGDIALRANNQAKDLYEVEMDITGNENLINLRGTYRSIVGGSEMDLKLDFTKMNLTSLAPFTFGNVHRLSGIMTGGVHMTGTMKKPSVVGELNFTNTAFNPVFLDSYLRLNNGRIVIDAKGIEFRSFDLVDTLGNIASLRGHIFTDDYRKFSYDFHIRTKDFLLLNKPQSKDALFYGTIILDSDVSVKGDQKKQKVTVQAELDKGTNLALLLPESELAVEERRGIIRFVGKKISENAILSRRDPGTNSDTTDVELSSMELTSNITVNKDSKLRILIDPIAGDSLVIRGEATLSFTIDPSGKITLTGRYDILEGTYQLSFGDFINREFAIAKGSSLTWLGSPLDAVVDITAIYTVKTSVLDLIQNQLGGISQEERNKYKQEIPIQVHLKMKGKLLTPEIHFKLDLPPDKRGVLNGTVYAKLNELNGQESELNKQVFALLILGRFISENPLASAGGNDGLSGFARSSASQILTAQLNRLSEQYIKGVSVNVGLESYQDYSSGNAEGRTQMQLALSKQLFDERVTVQVGGNVELEGERSRKNSLNNFAGDLKVLYKLTDDGRWQLQVFRQNTYEGAIDGDITKTGAGVVFTIDFDKLFGFTLKPVPK